MDAKKIIGVSLVIALVLVLGFVLVQKMTEMSPSSDNKNPPTASLQNAQGLRPGLSEEPQEASLPDTRKPTTVDAIVDDIEGESIADQSAVSSEVSGETSIIEDEGSALNEVSQFYDEKNL